MYKIITYFEGIHYAPTLERAFAYIEKEFSNPHFVTEDTQWRIYLNDSIIPIGYIVAL